MNNLPIASLIISILIITGCGKDNDESSKPDCESNNYGVLKTSFKALGYERMILVSNSSGGLARRKFIPAGSSTPDTIRLAANTYHVTISSPGAPGNPMQDFSNVKIIQCKENALAVTAF